MEKLPLIARARSHGDAVALRSVSGEHSYHELLDRSATLAATLLSATEDQSEARVAYLAPPGFDHITVQWAIWRAGAVAVAAVLDDGEELSPESLRAWCRGQLSHYKIPKRFLAVDRLPRNAMGKVTKPAVRELF